MIPLREAQNESGNTYRILISESVVKIIMANPAFFIIIFMVCIAVWFLASALYKPIGKFMHRIGKDAVDELMDKEKEENEN